MFLSASKVLFPLLRIRPVHLVCLVILAGCVQVSHTERVIQYFEPSSGATITTLSMPFSFYRKEPLLAVNSRDYIYVGPLEINRAGHREYYLWLHYCSTIDRSRNARVVAPNGIFLFPDGQPMELLRVRAAPLGRFSKAEPYAVPVAGGHTLYYRVTGDQLQILAGAKEIRIVAEDSSRKTDEYTVWNGAGNGFKMFANYLKDDADIVFAAVQ